MKSQVRFDIWRGRLGRWVLLRPWFPFVLQVAALAGMVWLTVNGLGIGVVETSDRLLVLRKTNLTTLAIWGLWWPAMIGVALTLGRAWCTVCPMELVSRMGDAVARRGGWWRLRLPAWMRAGWTVVAAYLALQVLVAGLAIHRVPHYTSLMLITLGGLALASGLLFAEPRTFCKAFCPAGALLSVYGRFTPIQLDVRSAEICSSCTTRDCVRAENQYHFDKRSCPSRIRPFSRSQSDGCVLCFQCAKTCRHMNVGFGVVSSSAGSRTHRPLLPFEAAFVAIAAGFVAHEVIGEVKWLDDLFHVVPSAMQRTLPAVAMGWFEAFWFLIAFPLTLWAVVAGMAWALGHRRGLRELFLAAATGAAPVIAVAHLAKAASKVVAWAGYLPLALRDPTGVETLERLTMKTVPAPHALLGLSLLGAIMATVLVLIGWRSWRWAQTAAPALLPATRAGFAVTTVLFSSVMFVWMRS